MIFPLQDANTFLVAFFIIVTLKIASDTLRNTSNEMWAFIAIVLLIGWVATDILIPYHKQSLAHDTVLTKSCKQSCLMMNGTHLGGHLSKSCIASNQYYDCKCLDDRCETVKRLNTNSTGDALMYFVWGILVMYIITTWKIIPLNNKKDEKEDDTNDKTTSR